MNNKNPSATKKGPGRYHKQGGVKGEATKPTFKRAAAKVKVAQQTANVTNTPLKSAARGS